MFAAPTFAAERQQWALLIGVEDYQHVPRLQFTVNDVQQLAGTLQRHGGFDGRRIKLVTDHEANSKPTVKTLKETIPAWLNNVKAGDTVLVYFSGHGFRDDQQKLYLAPLDFDLKRAHETGIAIDWLRQQIANCKADFKLLILDACHAGSEKGSEGATSVGANELSAAFDGLEGVVTMASSDAQQSSLIWAQKQRSLYSYWLTEGLKGHADLNSDGRVDIDEIYKYVSQRVTRTAKVRFDRDQTPVRIVRTGTKDVPPILELHPQPLDDLLSNMAEHVADILGERQQKSIGVLEFADDSQLQVLLGGKFGLLGKDCAEKLENYLVQIGPDVGFSVVDHNRLRRALEEQGFTLKDLSSSEKLVSLSKEVGGMPVVAAGTFRDRRGDRIRLQCKLQQTEGDEVLGVTGGYATISGNDWAMQGGSAELKSEDRLPPQPGESTTDTVIERLDEQSSRPHPFADPEFAYPIQVIVDGKVRAGEVRGNEYFVGLRKGEVYALQIGNRSGKPVVMRMLIDGLDTTLRKQAADSASQAAASPAGQASAPEADKGIATELWAQPVTHFDDAGWRLLDPADPLLADLNRDGRKDPVWGIRGFTTRTGTNGEVREFVVVDAHESLAGRQGFTEQVGMISAVFYEAKEPSGDTTRGGIGTAAGRQRSENIRATGVVPGTQLAIVHIRYVDVDALSAAAN